MKQFTCKRVLHVLQDEGSIHSVWFVRPDRLLVSDQHWSRAEEGLYGTVRLMTGDGRTLAKTRGGRSTGSTAVHPSRGEYACTGYESCTIHSLRSRRLPLLHRLKFDGQTVNRVLYTPDGQWLIWGGGRDNPNAGWDANSPTPPKSPSFQPLIRWNTADWTPHVLAESGQAVRSLALSPDGGTLLVGGGDGGIQLWNLARWELTAEWQSPRGLEDGKFPPVKAIQVTPDGRMLYARFGRRPYLRAFGLPGFTPAVPPLPEHKVGPILLLPDGRTLVTGDDHGFVTLWDVATLTRVAQYTADEERLFMVDVSTGESAYQVGSLGSVGALALSPDGGTLAVGDSFGRVHLLDLTP